MLFIADASWRRLLCSAMLRGCTVPCSGVPQMSLRVGGARSSRRHVRHAKFLAKASAPSSQAVATSNATPTPSRREYLASATALVVGTALAQPAFADVCTELVTAPNGMQFCDTVEGTGNTPAPGSMIRAHYTGRLASNGAVFDSSYNRGRPLQFKVGVRQVIQGWDLGILGTEGIPPMKEGGSRRLVIPAELGYGSRGAGGVIPPNADLIFDVELLPPRR